MSDAYERVNAGRLTFKGSGVASRPKGIDKSKKKKKSKSKLLEEFPPNDGESTQNDAVDGEPGEGGGEVIYTIDAAKKMKYDDLFPVEAKKFGYYPKEKVKSVEQALDDRVKKKADRYCK